MGLATEKALTAVLIILTGYLFRLGGVFSKDDYKIAAVMSLNITLPAAIIRSFATFEQDPSLYSLVAMGFLMNLLMLLAAWLATRNSPLKERIVPLFCLPGYVIGIFTMPYVGSILGPAAVVTACMFDIGNSIMSAGGTYAIVSSVFLKGHANKVTVTDIVKKLTSSVPFDLYMIAFAWTFFNMKLPPFLVRCLSPVADANFFVAMLMIGMMMDLTSLHIRIKTVAGTLLLRYGLAVTFAYMAYRFAPFPLAIRQVLTLVLLSPISALAPVFTLKCEGDYAAASLASSLSIVMSLILMTASLALMGIE